jgi:hypothetical protein
MICILGTTATFAASATENQIDRATEIFGKYIGYRDSNVAKQITQLQKQKFELVHKGKTKEANAIQKNKIAPLVKKLKSLPKCRLDTYAQTHVANGVFHIHLRIDPTSSKEQKTGGGYANQVWFDLTLDQFALLFASKRTINKMRVGEYNYRYNKIFASASTKGSTRTVLINQIYDESGKVTEDNKTWIVLNQNQIERIVVEKSRKKFVFGLKKYMSANISGISKVAQGLRLEKIGRVWNKSLIKRAINNKTNSNFYKLVKEQKK